MAESDYTRHRRGPDPRAYGGMFASTTRKNAVTPRERPTWSNDASFSRKMEESGLIPALWQDFTTKIGWANRAAGDMLGSINFGADRVGGQDRQGQPSSGGRTPSGPTEQGDVELFGGTGATPDQAQTQADMLAEQRGRLTALDAANDFLSNVAGPGMDLLEATDGVPLDAASKYKAEQFRLGLEEQTRQLDAQLQQMELNMQMQNQLYDVYEATAFQGNVVPGGDRQAEILNDWLGQGGESTGVRPEVATAIAAIMADPSLDGEEKMARVDFVMDQVSTQQQIRMGINDVTQNLADLETIKNMPDAQLLIESGENPEYVTPAFSYLGDPEVAADPEIRYNTNVANYVEESLGQAGVAIPAEQEEQFANWLFTLGPEPDWSSEQTSGQLRNFATAFRADEGLLRDSVNASMKSAAASEDAWANALTKQRLEPGSEEMAVAIFQVANMMGLPPELADALAESQGLHMIIKAKSNGAAGGTKGGTQMGVGGLSEEAYRKMGIDPANLGSMDVELGALIRYVLENFEGDPNAALAYYYSTGEWGV